MLKNNMLNIFKKIAFNKELISSSRAFNSKYSMGSFSFNKLNCFAFSDKSTMELIKILRAETNSPLNHIKKALEESKNDLEEAKIWLKKKGFKDAENKMGRKAETQISAFAHDETQGLIALAHMLCETDFVASNKMFVDFAKNFANFLLAHKTNLEETDFVNLTLDKHLKNIDPELNGLTLNECLKYLISKTGENCQIKNLSVTQYTPANEVAGTYLHNSLEATVGKKAALVVLQCEEGVKLTENQRNKLKELADQVAMQIVASKPRYLNKDDIPVEVLKRESELIKEGIMAQKADSSIVSKNDDTDYKNMGEENLNKLIEKKIKNWVDSVCLNEQEFVIVDHDSKASHEKTAAVVTKRAKGFGVANVKIKEFKSFF